VKNAPVEIPEDLRFTKKSWTAERVGWIGIAALIAGGLAGLFGAGPLSRARSAANGALQVDFDRFPHRQTETRIDVRVPADRVRDGALRIWVDRRWFDAVSIERVQPEPLSIQLGTDRVVYAFSAAGDGPLGLSFDVEFEKAGGQTAHFGVVDGGSVDVRQFVYP
jgi:hypothetical protein